MINFCCARRTTSRRYVFLSKLSEAKNHISVKVDMGEMDVTAAESKATYQEIQDWVQEKYGFHVTHLNIAKTKRKCGIIERQNYNLPKNEDSRSPETPKEKEEAIIEAFIISSVTAGTDRENDAADGRRRRTEVVM